MVTKTDPLTKFPLEVAFASKSKGIHPFEMSMASILNYAKGTCCATPKTPLCPPAPECPVCRAVKEADPCQCDCADDDNHDADPPSPLTECDPAVICAAVGDVGSASSRSSSSSRGHKSGKGDYWPKYNQHQQRQQTHEFADDLKSLVTEQLADMHTTVFVLALLLALALLLLAVLAAFFFKERCCRCCDNLTRRSTTAAGATPLSPRTERTYLSKGDFSSSSASSLWGPQRFYAASEASMDLSSLAPSGRFVRVGNRLVTTMEMDEEEEAVAGGGDTISMVDLAAQLQDLRN
jgi:hypothetical protein